MNIYADLTEKFNAGRQRAVLAGGQAVVLYRLAVMSKDGDWIIREDDETTEHILSVLESYGAHYRFGAPLDIRWLAGGWSSHLEFQHNGMRVRTDFVSRPPRISQTEVEEIWASSYSGIPKVDVCKLAEMKKTNREKDYAVIGELARIMDKPESQILHSRSARDLRDLSCEYPDLVKELSQQRPVLATVGLGIEQLETALDAERRQMIHANEARLLRYMNSAEEWAAAWPQIAKDIKNLTLKKAHNLMTERAGKLLPFMPREG